MDQAIEKNIIGHYERVYPKWKNFAVQELILDVFGGSIAVVTATDELEVYVEEICYVYQDETVREFVSTRELARFLESKSRESFFDKVTTRPMISGIISLALLIVLCVMVFFRQEQLNNQIVTVLGSAFGLAVGFFFGGGKRSS